ncbi:hypothetical protein LINGRAHAP2_LOCUS17388 [Linum grandiflorum]
MMMLHFYRSVKKMEEALEAELMMDVVTGKKKVEKDPGNGSPVTGLSNRRSSRLSPLRAWLLALWRRLSRRKPKEKEIRKHYSEGIIAKNLLQCSEFAISVLDLLTRSLAHSRSISELGFALSSPSLFSSSAQGN